MISSHLISDPLVLNVFTVKMLLFISYKEIFYRVSMFKYDCLVLCRVDEKNK